MSAQLIVLLALTHATAFAAGALVIVSVGLYMTAHKADATDAECSDYSAKPKTTCLNGVELP